MEEIPKVHKLTSSKVATIATSVQTPCVNPCTKIIKFMTDREVPPSTAISIPPYTNVEGYRHINIFVTFTEENPIEEGPVTLGVIFAFDSNGTMGARCYVNLEHNVQHPQVPNFVNVEPGSKTWHGTPKISSYVARFPVLGPYVQAFVLNMDKNITRKVSVWAYLVA